MSDHKPVTDEMVGLLKAKVRQCRMLAGMYEQPGVDTWAGEQEWANTMARYADAIEAMLDERERSRQDFERWNHRIRDLTNYSDKLKADVERLRKACRAVDAYEWPVDGHFDDCWWCDSKDAKRDSANGHTADCPAVLVPAALAATKQTNDTPARPEPAADRLGWFAWRDTVGMAIQTDEARASIKVTAGTEKEALALRAECFLLLEPLVRAIEPSANETNDTLRPFGTNDTLRGLDHPDEDCYTIEDGEPIEPSANDTKGKR